jgi:hypothetical protein
MLRCPLPRLGRARSRLGTSGQFLFVEATGSEVLKFLLGHGKQRELLGADDQTRLSTWATGC